MKAFEFDKKFDDGENIVNLLDTSRICRPKDAQKRINVDLPIWMITALDREARRMGVTRQSVIKMWLAERLQHQG